MKYNANIKFTDKRAYDRLLLLSVLKRKTMGDTILELAKKEFTQLSITIKPWGI